MKFSEYTSNIGFKSMSLEESDKAVEDFARGLGIRKRSIISSYMLNKEENLTDNQRIKFFDAIAPVYDKYMATMYDGYEAISHILNKEIGGSRRVLETMCGTGIVACYVAMSNPDIRFFGVDISPNMIEVSSTRKRQFGIRNLSFSTGDKDDLYFDSGYFDIVYATNIFNDGNLKEQMRVLKRGGRLIELGGPTEGRIVEDARLEIVKTKLDNGNYVDVEVVTKMKD